MNMPYTVSYSFDLLRSNSVDLDPEQVKKARKSRDYLKEQIEAVAPQVTYFPKLYGGYLAFGSFARKTKVRPLDDIDLLLLISAGAGSFTQYVSFNKYSIVVTDTSCPTWMCTNDDNRTLNSTKVLNKIKSSLYLIPNYKQADIKRTGEAVFLGLKSYDWNFDIVPAVPVSIEQGSTDHYLIPDGTGYWKRTDPRRDQKKISEANQKHNGNLIPIIRLLKYWNDKYYDVPKISSYYLETMLIHGFGSYLPMNNIRGNIRLAFTLLSSAVLGSCPDPKGLEADLDTHASWEDRYKVYAVAQLMAKYAAEATVWENNNNDKAAIETWRKVFPDFPAYG
jgi:hypothetical protein